jgi:hypothetical protein
MTGWAVTDDDLEQIKFRHKKRTDSNECRVDGDGAWPCRELRAATALVKIQRSIRAELAEMS